MDPQAFEELLAEGGSVPVRGWDFSWFDGRATEERPPWGYSRRLTGRLAGPRAALDLQTGGGEVFAEALARVSEPPPVLAATESWPPNAGPARDRLRRFGVAVVRAADGGGFPFAAGSFDLVVSRHPTVVAWDEIARVLAPGGTYFSQQVGAGSVRELTDFLMGPQPVSQARAPDRAVRAAEAAGLRVVDLRQASLRMAFHDVGAVVHFLRKVIWIVPDFMVDRYRGRLAVLHDQIQAEGPFVAHAQRFLIEAHRPGRDQRPGPEGGAGP
ncbi:MAG: methyltransferase domain-containing protein [Micromonosporaceae bacterium]|nr:methyltransferase domain-containing protein [Micromonosporaceae bacterium]